MYCKHCGHRTEEKIDACPKCGARLAVAVVLHADSKPKPRWQIIAASAVISTIVFVVLPRVFLRPELETIGPTDKLRLLRALDHSAYRRVGLRELRVQGRTLVLVWDLRWNALSEPKQQDIVRMVGRAWQVTGGEDTQFRIEGEDNSVASYLKGEVRSGSPNP